MSLGDAFDRGDLGHGAAYWEEMLGPGWRDLTTEEAEWIIDADLEQDARETAASDQAIAGYAERARIAEALLAKMGRAREAAAARGS
jgi:hypothetical protein